MKLVDTFLFSEPHEADVLWVKLNVESHVFHEWVVVENSYTMQGQYKGYFFKDIVNTDERFCEFLDKIHVVESDIKPEVDGKESNSVYNEPAELERAQRCMAVQYLLDKYSDDDCVMISDVDECLDTESDKRRKLLFEKIQTGQDLILLPRIRYWFDYDNRWLVRRCVPLVTIRQIKKDNRIYHYRKKWLGTPVVWRHEMVFEYSYCFTKHGIMRKYQTFAHTGYMKEDIDRALILNCVPVPKNTPGKKHRAYEKWFVKRNLNSRNSPEFVRKNIDYLQTGVISKNYAQNRMKEYPKVFPRNPFRRLQRAICLYKDLYGYILWENSNAYKHAYNGLHAIKNKMRS